MGFQRLRGATSKFPDMDFWGGGVGRGKVLYDDEAGVIFWVDVELLDCAFCG